MDTKEIEKIVKEACKAETNVFGYNIWTHHIAQVVEIGKKLAGKFNADPEIVEISALLHDYAGIKDHTLHKEHHIHGAIEAEKILKKLNYPSNKIVAVKHCIENHRGSVKSNKKSAEAECLANADAIAHIENVASLFFLAYFKHGMHIDEGRNWIYKKLQKSWKKIDPKFQYLAEDKYRSALVILNSNKNADH